MPHLTQQQDIQILSSLANGEIWTRKKLITFIHEQYRVKFTAGGMGKYLKSRGLDIENRFYPKICATPKIKDWFQTRFEKLKHELTLHYRVYWVGKKEIEAELNMLYCVNLQGAIHFSLIKGKVTRTKQTEFMEKMAKSIAPKKLVFFRTREDFYTFNDKQQYRPAINKVYPNQNDLKAATQVTASLKSTQQQ